MSNNADVVLSSTNTTTFNREGNLHNNQPNRIPSFVGCCLKTQLKSIKQKKNISCWLIRFTLKPHSQSLHKMKMKTL